MPSTLGLVEQIADDAPITQLTPISALFNDPSGLYQRNRLDSTLRYLLRTPMQKISPNLNEEFRERFLSFENGADLAALILQMGRDHGLAGYSKFRKACGLKSPEKFSDLKFILMGETNEKSATNLDNEEIFDELIIKMEKIYVHVDDIDLFVGGLAEIPLKGSLVGPTFACVLEKQFEQVFFILIYIRLTK